MGQLGYLNIVDIRSLTCPKYSNLAHKSFKCIITFPTGYTLSLCFFWSLNDVILEAFSTDILYHFILQTYHVNITQVSAAICTEESSTIYI